MTHYVFRGDYGGGNHHPRTWELQGSNDGNGWTCLKVHSGDNSVTMSKCGSWSVETSKSFRMFRIYNKATPNYLCCSGIEFYGMLTQEEDRKQKEDLADFI